MGRIFVTSDTHFGHDREFVYVPRGFNSIGEHDETIIARWNETVGEDDIVYHLGDVMLGDNSYGIECVKRLKGIIYIIPGNHDTTARINLYKQLNNIHYCQTMFESHQLSYMNLVFYHLHHISLHYLYFYSLHKYHLK